MPDPDKTDTKPKKPKPKKDKGGKKRGKVVLRWGDLYGLTFDKNGRVHRRFGWSGDILVTPEPGDRIFRRLKKGDLRDEIKLDLPRLSPRREPRDRELLGGGPIELTPSGPRQPSEPVRPRPVPEPNDTEHEDPIELDLWGHIPRAFPLPPWLPEFPIPQPDDEPPYYGPFLPEKDWALNPCDPLHPFGPLSPLINPGQPDIELIFPRIPWMGPLQSPTEQALMDALREFLGEIGKAADKGTLHSHDWERAGTGAAEKAGKRIWKFIQEHLENRYLDGDLSYESICALRRRRPWLFGVGVVIGASGYGLFLGHQYKRTGKLKLDFGDFEFEYNGKTGEWSFGLRFKFKF